MKILGMKELNSNPSSSLIPSPDDVRFKSREERKEILDSLCEKIVDDFIHTEFKVLPTSGPVRSQLRACTLINLICIKFIYYYDIL